MSRSEVSQSLSVESGLPADLMVCPGCRGAVHKQSAEAFTCRQCNRAFDAVEGIPDLRDGEGDSAWEQQDLESARRYSAEMSGTDITAVMQQLSDRPEDDVETRAMRVRQIINGPPKFRRQFEGWLAHCVAPGNLLLDIGCGSGGLLAAASSLGIRALGVDASMTNLVAAKHMIEAHGGAAQLVCAYAERLPFSDGSVANITLYDSIEHVSDVGDTLFEAHRVLRPGGRMAISTPNRFSLTREPHVLVWGVGWLPRRLQAPYVKWRAGQPYDHTRLMSAREMARKLSRHEGLECAFRVPPVPQEEIANFPPRRARLARLYNRVCSWAVLRALLLAVGPFYQVVATRRP
ncbi:MAG: methyltransferase domain-containing protein [Halioglobus sp.]|nr:methyltransferase domain-containing protein [Halioglobus sp.]